MTPAATKPVLRIHFLVFDPAGPIESLPAGAPVKVSTGGKFRVCCDPTIPLNEWNRATGEPWGVRCNACMATEEFQRLNRPKPGLDAPDRTEETDPCHCAK